MLLAPTYDNKPGNTSKEEFINGKEEKYTAEWHYNKLTGESAEEYREMEKAHVKRSHDQQQQNLIDAARQNS